MSYSFTIAAVSKDEAGQKVADALGEVVTAQPVHATDRQAAQDAAEAFIGLVAEPGADEVINVSVSGSLGWRAENVFTASSVSVQAWVAQKPQETA